jgi:hypothetical protein
MPARPQRGVQLQAEARTAPERCQPAYLDALSTSFSPQARLCHSARPAGAAVRDKARRDPTDGVEEVGQSVGAASRHPDSPIPRSRGARKRCAMIYPMNRRTFTHSLLRILDSRWLSRVRALFFLGTTGFAGVLLVVGVLLALVQVVAHVGIVPLVFIGLGLFALLAGGVAEVRRFLSRRANQPAHGEARRASPGTKTTALTADGHPEPLAAVLALEKNIEDLRHRVANALDVSTRRVYWRHLLASDVFEKHQQTLMHRHPQIYKEVADAYRAAAEINERVPLERLGTPITPADDEWLRARVDEMGHASTLLHNLVPKRTDVAHTGVSQPPESAGADAEELDHEVVALVARKSQEVALPEVSGVVDLLLQRFSKQDEVREMSTAEADMYNAALRATRQACPNSLFLQGLKPIKGTMHSNISTGRYGAAVTGLNLMRSALLTADRD